MIERRKLLKIGASGIAASVAMPFVGRTGWAATPTHTLKLTFADTQNHPLYDVLKRFSEDVSKRTSGAVETGMWARNRAIPGVIEEIEALTPLRRWSTPDDVADVVVFLASDAARFVTGETMCVDGGMARTTDLYGGAV